MEAEIEGAADQASTKNSGAEYAYSYEYNESYRETEKLTFAAKGQVKTKSEEKINFNLDLNVSRSFFREKSVEVQGGNAKLLDPLVVNYDGEAAELEEENMDFVLDVDGIKDKIYRLAPCSGFITPD